MNFNKNGTLKRWVPSVSAGSMADIAFLLLIFFLVTTTIVQDKGILVKLPPWINEPISVEVNEKNVFTLLINKDDEILAENQKIEITELKDEIITFITNPSNSINAPDNPAKAVISIINDRNTTYNQYLEVYDIIMAAYQTIWDNAALKSYGTAYIECNVSQKKAIRNQYPQIISEAEPKTFVAY